MTRLFIIPLAVALVPILIPAVRDWVSEKVTAWKVKRRRSD